MGEKGQGRDGVWGDERWMADNKVVDEVWTSYVVLLWSRSLGVQLSDVAYLVRQTHASPLLNWE